MVSCSCARLPDLVLISQSQSQILGTFSCTLLPHSQRHKMQLITRFWLLACVCGKIAAANMLSSNLVVHESVTARRGYVNVGPAAADTALNLRLGLVSADFATLEKRLYEVSTPSSSKYGQHLSTEEVGTIVSSFSSSLTTIAGQIIHGAQG
jgi:hypothetical protein